MSEPTIPVSTSRPTSRAGTSTPPSFPDAGPSPNQSATGWSQFGSFSQEYAKDSDPTKPLPAGAVERFPLPVPNSKNIFESVAALQRQMEHAVEDPNPLVYTQSDPVLGRKPSPPVFPRLQPIVSQDSEIKIPRLPSLEETAVPLPRINTDLDMPMTPNDPAGSNAASPIAAGMQLPQISMNVRTPTTANGTPGSLTGTSSPADPSVQLPQSEDDTSSLFGAELPEATSPASPENAGTSNSDYDIFAPQFSYPFPENNMPTRKGEKSKNRCTESSPSSNMSDPQRIDLGYQQRPSRPRPRREWDNALAPSGFVVPSPSPSRLAQQSAITAMDRLSLRDDTSKRPRPQEFETNKVGGSTARNRPKKRRVSRNRIPDHATSSEPWTSNSSNHKPGPSRAVIPFTSSPSTSSPVTSTSRHLPHNDVQAATSLYPWERESPNLEASDSGSAANSSRPQTSSPTATSFRPTRSSKRKLQDDEYEMPKKKKNRLGLKDRFYCDICRASFGRQADCKRHYEQIHEKDKQDPAETICPICGKEVSRKDALGRHLRTGHNGTGRELTK